MTEDGPTDRKERSAVVAHKREIRTCAQLWHASGCVLNARLADENGSSWQFLSSLVLTAFAFEAYLNDVGETTLSLWQPIDRISPLAKLKRVCKHLNVQLPDEEERPMITVRQLLKFRNELAHGRTYPLSRVRVVEVGPGGRLPAFHSRRERLLTDWERGIEEKTWRQSQCGRAEPEGGPFRVWWRVLVGHHRRVTSLKKILRVALSGRGCQSKPYYS
jgi:hypothetical protein